jgi:hypothetical protein
MDMNIKAIIYFSMLMLALASCKREDLLDRTPQDGLSEPVFFKNESDLKLYCNTLYSLLPVQKAVDRDNNIDDNNSDDMVPAQKNAFLAGQYVIPVTGGGWVWEDIRKCNYFLQRYQRAEADEAVKNKYAAEARFFRALLYWQKVKRFGDVPWYSKDLNEQSPELYTPRNKHKDVMDSVLADLNFAVEHLPAPADAEKDRLHKYAAAALKARICLWEGTFRKYHGLGDQQRYLREAVTAAELIINSGLYELYSTGDPAKDYYNLFIQEELGNNKEAIMAKRYVKDVMMHNLTRQLGESNTGFSNNFARAFLCKDGLPISLSPLYKGDDSPEEESANRDPRYAQLIATRGFVFLANADGSKDTISLPRIGTSITPTGYQVIKGRSSDLAQWNAAQSTLDLFIFRYAEILLIDAEAKAELNECDQVVLDRTINKIRSRVGMPPMLIAALEKDPASDFPALPVLLDEIRRERRIELAAEGSRFDDLLRWKAGKRTEDPSTILGMKLLPAVRAQYPNQGQVRDIQVDADGYIRVYTDIRNRVWNDKLYLYPIPTQELTLNPKLLPQNGGW